MAVHIQLRTDESQRATEQECTIGGVRVLLRARYSQISDRWYLSIYDTGDALLIGSIPCVPGVDLLRPYKHLAIPQGELFVSSADRSAPTFDTIDVTARVVYR